MRYLLFGICILFNILKIYSSNLEPAVPLESISGSFVYNGGSPYAPIRIQVIFDPLCHASKYNHPFVKQIATEYGPNLVRVEYIPIGVPQHSNSLMANQGLFYMLKNMPNQTMAYIEMLFENLDNYTSEATYQYSPNQVLRKITELVGNYTTADKEDFYEQVEKSVYEYDTYFALKYAYMVGFKGTPWYWINGAEIIRKDYLVPVSAWREIIENILKIDMPEEAGKKRICKQATPQIMNGSANSPAGHFSFQILLILFIFIVIFVSFE